MLKTFLRCSRPNCPGTLLVKMKTLVFGALICCVCWSVPPDSWPETAEPGSDISGVAILKQTEVIAYYVLCPLSMNHNDKQTNPNKISVIRLLSQYVQPP